MESDPVQRQNRESRNQLIEQRIREGMPLALISQRTGVSQNMVSKIKAAMLDRDREIITLEAKGKGGITRMDKFAAGHKMVEQIKSGMETHEAQDIKTKIHAILDLIQKDVQAAAAAVPAQGKGK